jgi:predicted dehydrogenase
MPGGVESKPPYPLRVGLVGAGPWAMRAHIPLLTGGPETELVGVWARRLDRAQAVAAATGCIPYDRLDRMFTACDAVAFAVPPDVQPVLAIQAANAGLALLLDKPLALDVASAHAVRDAVVAAGVSTVHFLTYEFHPETRAFLAAAQARDWLAADARFLTGSFLPGNPFATPWRLEQGPLADLGPHALDLVEHAVGPISRVDAASQTADWTSVICRHIAGAISTISLSGTIASPTPHFDIELFGSESHLRLSPDLVNMERNFAELRHAFAACARHPSIAAEIGVPDVHRAVRLVELLAETNRVCVDARGHQ